MQDFWFVFLLWLIPGFGLLPASSHSKSCGFFFLHLINITEPDQSQRLDINLSSQYIPFFHWYKKNKKKKVFYCDLSSSWISFFVSATAVTALSRQICINRFYSVCLSVFVRVHEWRMCRAVQASDKAPALWVSYQRWNKITLPSPHPQRTCSRYRESVINIQAASAHAQMYPYEYRKALFIG